MTDPFAGHIDELRIAHVPRSDGWIEINSNDRSGPGTLAIAAARLSIGGPIGTLLGSVAGQYTSGRD